MKNNYDIASRWETLIFKFSVAVLVLSGLAQMPLFKRYYISEIPGLAWTADFHFNHILHHVAAAVLLFVLFRWSVIYLRTKKHGIRLSISGWIRTGLFATIIITGLLRALKNLPGFYFSPLATTSIIWIHLTASALLGVAAIYAYFAAGKYLTHPNFSK